MLPNGCFMTTKLISTGHVHWFLSPVDDACHSACFHSVGDKSWCLAVWETICQIHPCCIKASHHNPASFDYEDAQFQLYPSTKKSGSVALGIWVRATVLRQCNPLHKIFENNKNYQNTVIKNASSGTGEMAHQLRALTALEEEPGSVLCTYVMPHNHLQFQSQGIWCYLSASVGTRHSSRMSTFMQANTHIHKIKS